MNYRENLPPKEKNEVFGDIAHSNTEDAKSNDDTKDNFFDRNNVDTLDAPTGED